MEENQELTPEQIQERKEKLISYYKDQIDFLKTQLSYETLLTDIDEQRAKRIQLQAAVASFLAPEEEEEEPAPTKTLRRTK